LKEPERDKPVKRDTEGQFREVSQVARERKL